MRLLFLLLLPLYIFAKPIWFYNLETNNNKIIGYGLSEDLYEAKRYAIDEIAKTINLNINSSTSIKKEVKNNQYSKTINSNIKIDSNLYLSNIKYIKVEQIDNLWYVAALYENSLIETIIKRNLINKKLKNSEQNSYLKNTPLIKSLNKNLKKELDYKIVFKNKSWYLKYNDYIHILNQEEFYRLFYNSKNKNLKFKTNKKSFEEGESISFHIKSKNKGFISIINVEHNGKIGVLLSNQKIKEEYSFPENNRINFQIANPYSYPIKEEYILIFSNNKLNLSEFEIINNSLLDENSFKFDKLIKFLNNKNFITTQINISKGY